MLAALGLLGGCEGGRGGGEGAAGGELVVSAAASLSDVLAEAGAEFQRRHPGLTVRHNFAASGALEQQIRHGAPVDLFVSAARRQVEALTADSLLVPGTRRVVAGNELVLVAPAADPPRVRAFADLAGGGVRRVALGVPESVPAGAYAREALRSLGLWEAVEPRAVLAASVRQALAYVQRGEVDAALVYRTDARAAAGLRLVAAAPPGSHAPIEYPAAVVAGSGNAAAARAYLDYLAGPEGARLFRRHGFTTPAGS